MALAPGAQLGPYSITAEIGRGGMGIVFLAQDPRLKRQVAIKLLPPDLSRDATAKQRFLQEAQAASALDHPNICTIHEINETADGQLYLVMAHYAGETLKERIARGPLALDDAVDIATQVGQGLAEAHGAGIVHRNSKPPAQINSRRRFGSAPAHGGCAKSESSWLGRGRNATGGGFGANASRTLPQPRLSRLEGTPSHGEGGLGPRPAIC